LTFAVPAGQGKVAPMLWKLRIFWYRLDKAALAFAAFFGLVVGALAFAAGIVFMQREAELLRQREFHARHLDCLARNVYYEARGESLLGQYAVAEVTMNRRASRFYPKTVCEVVFQREAFSWTSLRDIEEPEGPAWQRAVRVAEDVYYQRRPATMKGVTHYHATYVQPDWSKERRQVARIGKHVFYR
jgi:spore germination cell wall hydrolase CwlJ-like protein